MSRRPRPASWSPTPSPERSSVTSFTPTPDPPSPRWSSSSSEPDDPPAPAVRQVPPQMHPNSLANLIRGRVCPTFPAPAPTAAGSSSHSSASVGSGLDRNNDALDGDNADSSSMGGWDDELIFDDDDRVDDDDRIDDDDRGAVIGYNGASSPVTSLPGSGNSSGEADEEEEEPWARFVREAREDLVVLMRLASDQDVWVVQGWHARKNEPTTRFYHLVSRHGNLACACPLAAPCLHVQAYASDRPLFDMAATMAYVFNRDDDVALFACGGIQPARFGLSVRQSSSAHDSGKRVVVTQDNRGQWRCSGAGCHRSSCDHVSSAQRQLQGAGLLDEEGALVDEYLLERAAYDDEARREVDDAAFPPVSHLRRAPPSAIRLACDDGKAGLPPSPSLLPESGRLRLDDGARCRCGVEWAGSLEGAEFRPFLLYTEFDVVHLEIQTVPCSRCNKRRIGPDLQGLDLINYNNHAGFSRQVFDSYLSQFTRSETPITAYYNSMVDRYINYGARAHPPSQSTFRRTFYAYLNLADLDTGMRCPQCGTTPDIIICDGTVMGFEARRLKGQLRPPTLPTSSSTSRPNVRPIPTAPIDYRDLGLAFSTWRDYRRVLLTWAKGAPAIARATSHAADNALVEVARTSAIGLALSSFVRVIGREQAGPSRKALCNILIQVLGDTSIFALIPAGVFAPLRAWVTTGARKPALFKLCPVLAQLDATPRPEVAVLFAMLLDRAEKLLTTLEVNAAVEAQMPLEDAWLAQQREEAHPGIDRVGWTGAHYGQPAFRGRPLFPRLEDDGGARNLRGERVRDAKREEGSCNKYYELYGRKQGLIGGMFGFWCKHGICVGYHLIPSSEGRDDAFSALFCRWEEAPRIIVYDFACQLQKYCMIRAPAFFRNTRFLVDELHTRGHKDCTAASHVASAMMEDPDLRLVSTSIAECAHAVLGRLRRSISYMTESHAIKFIDAGIQVHNRRRMIEKGLEERSFSVSQIFHSLL